MKKIQKLLLMTAIAIGMVACSNDDVPQAPESAKGNTYASIAITLPGRTSTRTALTDKWKGNDVINTISVFLVSSSGVDHTSFTKDDFLTLADGVIAPNKAISTNSGKVKAYVVLNGNKTILDALKEVEAADAFDDKFKEVVTANASSLAKDNVIMMTNDVTPEDVTIEANISADKAIAGTSNRIDVKVSRVVSRAMVTKKSDAITIPIKGLEIGAIERKLNILDVNYAVGQSNKQFFMIEPTDGVSTPELVFNYVPTDTDWSTNNNKFDYSGLNNSTKVQDATGGTSLDQFKDQLTDEGESSKFVLPVTHAEDNYKKGNTTYFEVQVTFTPDAVIGDEYVAGNGVFLGMNDKKFYTTRALAIASGQLATEYKGTGTGTSIDESKRGVIAKYVLWLNPDKVPGFEGDKTKTSPTVRNQVYHAHITEFKELGLPNNPLNPVDPTDPANPKNPIDPTDPLETDKTYLSVQISVLEWGVNSYDIDLGNDY